MATQGLVSEESSAKSIVPAICPIVVSIFLFFDKVNHLYSFPSNDILFTTIGVLALPTTCRRVSVNANLLSSSSPISISNDISFYALTMNSFM